MATDFGVYVHVPFCRIQCPYCTFFTVAQPQSAPPMERWLAAAAIEWRLRVRPRLARGDRVRTLYIGGGTPSDLPQAAFAAFLASLAADLDGGLAAQAEVTVECNPESASPAWLDAIAALGVGRLSLGVQALDDRDLRVLGRGGDAACARRAIADVGARFATWSADLIVGVPGGTTARLLSAVDELAAAGAPHLSFYCLEMPRQRALRLGDPQTEASENRKAAMYLATAAAVGRHGYVHYEISSAAKPGHRAEHNTSYWSGREYVGLGAGAHSFEAGCRRANRPDLLAWLRALEADRPPPATIERLSAAMRRDEALLCGLRRREGIPRVGLEAAAALLERLEAAGLAWQEGERAGLTPRGWLVSDAIVLQLVAALDRDPGRIDNEFAASLDLPV